ncbi:MAG: type IV secretion system protein [Methylotenera sp.]
MNWATLFGGLPSLEVLINLWGALQIAQSAMASYASYAMQSIKPYVYTWLTLFVVLYGFALMRGVIKDPINDVAIRVFKITVITVLAINIGNYDNYVIQFFWTMPDKLIEWITPNPVLNLLRNIVPPGYGGTDLSILLISGLMSAVMEIMNSGLLAANVGGQTDPTAFAAGLGIGVAGAGIVGVVAGILLVAKMSLSILLALGPFFLITILFEKTKHYFDGWLAQVVNYVVVVVLLTLTIYLLFPILLITVGSYYALAKIAGALSLKESVELMTLLGIFLAVIRQVPTTAAALVRGYAISGPQERSLVGSSSNSQSGKSATQIQAEQRNASGN